MERKKTTEGLKCGSKLYSEVLCCLFESEKEADTTILKIKQGSFFIKQNIKLLFPSFSFEHFCSFFCFYLTEHFKTLNF